MREVALVPHGIGRRLVAGGVQFRDLLGAQRPSRRPDILYELRLVARADDEGRYRAPLQEPVERDLGERLAGLGGDGVDASTILNSRSSL